MAACEGGHLCFYILIMTRLAGLPCRNLPQTYTGVISFARSIISAYICGVFTDQM